jgi:hypothetical protein
VFKRGADPSFLFIPPLQTDYDASYINEPFGEGDKGGEVKHHSTTRFFATLQNDKEGNEMLRPDGFSRLTTSGTPA